MTKNGRYNIVGYGSPEGSPRSISSILLSFGKNNDMIRKVSVNDAQTMVDKGQINLPSNIRQGVK